MSCIKSFARTNKGWHTCTSQERKALFIALINWLSKAVFVTLSVLHMNRRFFVSGEMFKTVVYGNLVDTRDRCPRWADLSNSLLVRPDLAPPPCHAPCGLDECFLTKNDLQQTFNYMSKPTRVGLHSGVAGRTRTGLDSTCRVQNPDKFASVDEIHWTKTRFTIFFKLHV